MDRTAAFRASVDRLRGISTNHHEESLEETSSMAAADGGGDGGQLRHRRPNAASTVSSAASDAQSNADHRDSAKNQNKSQPSGESKSSVAVGEDTREARRIVRVP